MNTNFNIQDDEQFVLNLLNEQRVFVVSGKGFNHHDEAHFRVVFLPNTSVLEDASNRIGNYLEEHRHRKELVTP